MTLASKKGWCPGALRPMPTGDGLLLRVKPSGGRMSLDAAATLADLAQRRGNGILEISQRANWQLRGMAERDLPSVWDSLAAHGLIESDPEIEAVRNILVSPLSDLDPEAVRDLAPHVAAWEARLAWDAGLRKLPAKFSVALDAGGRFALREGAHVSARATRAGWDIFTSADPAPLKVGRDALAEALARVALESASRGLPAMRGDTEQTSPDLGALALGAAVVAILAPPLGRMRATALAPLLREAGRLGARDLRLMPRRRFALTGLDAMGAARLCERAEALGFIAWEGDPRLAVVACAGRPACAGAARDAQADALALARELPASGGIVLHVSGCSKGCARAAPTRLTLVANADGYDAVIRGRADGAPTLRNLTLDAARRLVALECRGP